MRGLLLAQRGAALYDGPMEESFRGGHRHQGGSLAATAALPADRDAPWVSSKGLDIVPYPLQGLHQILLTEVDGFGILSAQGGQVQIAQDVEAVIDRDHHDVSLPGQRRPFLGRQEDGGSGRITPAMEPDEYRALPAVQARRPDIEHLAILGTLFVLELEAEVIVAGISAPVHVLTLTGLRAVNLGFLDALPRVGIRGRHETGGLGIRDPFEGINPGIVIAHDLAGSGFHDTIVSGRDGADSSDLAIVLAGAQDHQQSHRDKQRSSHVG